MAQTKLKVSGMSCDGCVRSVSKIIAMTTGHHQAEVEVDLDDGEAEFPEVEDEKMEEVLEKLEKQGFAAEKVA